MLLDARSCRILQLAIEAYIESAQPVSSAAVAQRGRALRLSPATIRLVMAELEEQGLLQQPHTSAGRIPTERGLRAYLDGLMSPKLHPWDRSRLDEAAAQPDPSEFPTRLGHSLAGLSGQVAVMAVPRFLTSRFVAMGLVRCTSGRFLAYFVSPGGLVQQKLVQVDFDLSNDEVAWAVNFLNDKLRNRTVCEVQQIVRDELQQAEETRDLLRRCTCTIAERALPDPEIRWVVEGASHLLDQPEFAAPEKLRSALHALDDKASLLRLIDRILDSRGVRVVLGSEHQVREAAELVCVGSRFASPAGSTGAVALIGPQRMDYGRLVPMVRYAMELFEGYCQRL